MKSLFFKQEIWQAKKRVLDTLGEAQTRRLITPQPPCDFPTDGMKGEFSVCGRDYIARFQPGEIVYIREALRKDAALGDTCYGDTNMTPVFLNGEFGKFVKWRWKADQFRVSPYYMTEDLARYFVQITAVRPERFNYDEMTEEDYQREGGPDPDLDDFLHGYDGKWLWVYSFKWSGEKK